MSIKKLSLIFSFLIVFLAGSMANTAENEEVETDKKTTSEHINDFFEPIVAQMNTVLFFDPFEWAGIYDPIIYNEDGAVVLDKEIHSGDNHLSQKFTESSFAKGGV